MTTDTIAGLRAARALIERGWTQHYYARDAQGDGVEPEARAAVSWCAEGACYAAFPRSLDRINAALQALCDEADASLPDWNDAPRRTKRQVLRLFDRTIARLEAEAAA